MAAIHPLSMNRPALTTRKDERERHDRSGEHRVGGDLEAVVSRQQRPLKRVVNALHHHGRDDDPHRCGQ